MQIPFFIQNPIEGLVNLISSFIIKLSTASYSIATSIHCLIWMLTYSGNIFKEDAVTPQQLRLPFFFPFLLNYFKIQQFGELASIVKLLLSESYNLPEGGNHSQGIFLISQWLLKCTLRLLFLTQRKSKNCNARMEGKFSQKCKCPF